MAVPTQAQRRQWEEDGYLVLPEAIRGEELDRLQRTFDHWAEACKEEWLDKIARGEQCPTYYDIPDPFEKDPFFIDLVDHPSWYDLLQSFTGGELLFIHPQMRTVPLWPLSYTGWHQDVPPDSPLHPKVQIYVDDVAPETGEFGFVPGSHRPESGPYFRPRRQESMPGHRTFAGRAGTAIMFNARGWHAAMDNRSRTPRKSIILIYEKRTPGKASPDTFAAIARHCTTPERRVLFGLET
jgi:hypothetical protein